MSKGKLTCIGCGQAVGEPHGLECPIGFILQDIVDEDDCYPGED